MKSGQPPWCEEYDGWGFPTASAELGELRVPPGASAVADEAEVDWQIQNLTEISCTGGELAELRLGLVVPCFGGGEYPAIGRRAKDRCIDYRRASVVG
ncbi:hypothetical protein N9N28_16565 [Rubripirellula amarantea]|nr:hypothetical protein [Rubripirellula amarantea]